jgi:Zn-dependent peptidase ImmA (M78 family)
MLAKPQIHAIEAKAKAVLETVFGNAVTVPLPVPLDNILEKYEMIVAVGEFEDNEISGAYEKKDKTIYIADDETPNRKAFTIAHELGHYFLHEKKKNDLFYRTQILNITDEDKKEEQEANWFAATLLMPEPQLKHYFKITQDVGELAVVFGVSSTAVYYRLKNLGFIT